MSHKLRYSYFCYHLSAIRRFRPAPVSPKTPHFSAEPQISSQVYWSDSQPFGVHRNNYHEELDLQVHARVPATKIITEVNVSAV